MNIYILKISILFTLILSSCIIEHDNEPPCEGFNGTLNGDCASVTATIETINNAELITINFRDGGNNISVSVTDVLVKETLYLQGTRIFNLSGDGVYNNPSIKIGFTSINRETRTISGSFSFTSDSYTDASFGTREVDGIDGSFEDVIYTIVN